MPLQCFTHLHLSFWDFFCPLEKFWTQKMVILVDFGHFWSFFFKMYLRPNFGNIYQKSRKNVFFEALMMYFHFLAILIFFRFLADLKKIFSHFFGQNLGHFFKIYMRPNFGYIYQKKNKKTCFLKIKNSTIISPRLFWFLSFFLTSGEFLVSKNGHFWIFLVIFFKMYLRPNFGYIYRLKMIFRADWSIIRI